MKEDASTVAMMTDQPDRAERAQPHYGRGDGSNIPRADDKKGLPESSLQNSLFARAGASDAPAWSDSTRGRLMIRTISRGIFGAAFFTIGGRMATKQLQGYTESTGWKDIDKSKPLQYVAKGFDATLGRIIEGSVRGISSLHHTSDQAAKIGRDAVTFRETKNFSGQPGRSYGADVVGFTFDFAMASVGDALARNVIQAFDPNIKQTWRVNDKGEMAGKGEKWHFKPGEFGKWAGSTAWRIVSKNQGEDWAAAIPYAFQMKFQRQFLTKVFNKRWEGHQLVFDNTWHGGAYKMDKASGKIVGDYQLAGAIDLHARFVGYNWYTLMFREGYDAVGSALKKWKEDGFAIHPHVSKDFNPITSTIDAVGNSALYVTKSFIKANMYMNPAMLFFWPARVSQSKWRSGGEHVIMENGAAKLEGVKHQDFNPFDNKHYEHYPTNTVLDRFEKRFSQGMNVLGKGQYWTGSQATKFTDKLASKNLLPGSKWLGNVFERDAKGYVLAADRQKFVREYVDSSLAYTPYFMAKAEFGLRVDDSKGDGKPGQMDKAIYQFMGDVASFKFGRIGQDVKHMWRLGTNFEREVKMREGGGPDALEIHSKAPDQKRPQSIIQTSQIKRTGTTEHPQHAANEAQWTQAVRKSQGKEAASNDEQYDAHKAQEDDRLWAQKVVGSDYNAARIQPSSPTRH